MNQMLEIKGREEARMKPRFGAYPTGRIEMLSTEPQLRSLQVVGEKYMR